MSTTARALGSMFIVLISAYIASRTGSAADFFWPRVLLNAASALAFVIAASLGFLRRLRAFEAIKLGAV